MNQLVFYQGVLPVTQGLSSANRRDFLKTSGTAIAAASVIGAMTSTAHAGFHVAGRDTIRIGLIGCGGRGRGAAIQAMNTQSGNVELVACGDVFEENLNDAIKTCATTNKGAHKDKVRVDAKTSFVGFDAYKKVLDSDINLVILATPPGFRPLHFEAAIAAGKHVFMEKPVAVDAPGVRRILAATEIAKQKGLAVGVGLQRRHERAYRETIEQLHNGIIGDLIYAQAYWNQGALWNKNRADYKTEIEFQIANWLYFAWLSGDHIVEQHIHNLDVINWVANDFPASAQGLGGRQVRVTSSFGEIFDHHAVEYTYPSGLVMTSQCRQIEGCWNSVSEHVYGANGYCNIAQGKIFERGTKRELFSTKGARDGHQQEHHDLFADLQNGVIPNEGEYGAKSTLTAIMGRLATYTGKEIKWDKLMASNVALANFDEIADFNLDAPVQPNEKGEYDFAKPGINVEKFIDWEA